MFCWETLGSGIHVDVTLTCTTYLNIVADQVYPFMVTEFPNGSGLFHQDNAPCHTAKIVQEWFEEHDKELKIFLVLNPCRSSSCWTPAALPRAGPLQLFLVLNPCSSSSCWTPADLPRAGPFFSGCTAGGRSNSLNQETL
ncbi:hypothetical protein PGIGA_G00178730 [Pangasianodon gigas]|uniref:Uncharacterized protein n=1 Tax=Pangasianodon gigas TaxID=30993 RepID=A0ACC5XVD8_PANGG|nr:hypothetical protein [Pangasianodon gigas]